MQLFRGTSEKWVDTDRGSDPALKPPIRWRLRTAPAGADFSSKRGSVAGNTATRGWRSRVTPFS